VKEPVVCDSTCLIGLERIDRLSLLPALFEPTLAFSLQFVVDAGEAEAIALAYETEALLVLDDRPARAVARHLKIRIVGTVGILLRAKHLGLLDAVGPVFTQLKATGFYVADELIAKALNLAKE
jgi:predicted nucleic acid-binding protein